jgi:hypothetical protein
MTRFGVACRLTLMSLFFCATPAAAQQSRCADCHFSRPDAPAPDHYSDWDRSAHGRNNVGCEKCHGGDATTFEPFVAHGGILNSVNPASPVNRRNLSATCGTCHVGPFVGFQKSQHFALLEKGDAEFRCVRPVTARLGFADRRPERSKHSAVSVMVRAELLQDRSAPKLPERCTKRSTNPAM